MKMKRLILDFLDFSIVVVTITLLNVVALALVQSAFK